MTTEAIPDVERCLWCGRGVRVMAMVGTGFCCDRHRHHAAVIEGRAAEVEAAEAATEDGDDREAPT